MLFHGTNAVVKGPPWLPDISSFSTDISIAEEDFQWMQKLGLNMLRLGVMWPGVEPTRGHYNESYLDGIERIVDLAAKHGVWTLLDMHQDGLSEYFCGEGIPTWAVVERSTGLFAFPAPYDHFDTATDFYTEERLPDSPRLPTRKACDTHNLGPGWHEGTMAASRGYQALYENANGTLDAWAAMWAHVAARFKGRPEVLGLELINEPFAGNFYRHPSLMPPRPNPWNADKVNLQPAYDRINTAVREVNDEVLIFFAGVTFGDLGAGFTHAPGGDNYANRSVLAYHYYNPPQKRGPLQFRVQSQEAKRIGTAAFLTETSIPLQSNVGDFADSADEALQSWASWQWKRFFREEQGVPTTNISQLGVWGAGKTGIAHISWSDNPPMPPDGLQMANSRTYAPAVCGDTVSQYFNVSSSYFELQYDVNGLCTQGAATEIYVSQKHYPSGFSLEAATNPQGGDVHAVHDGETVVRVVAAASVAKGTRVVVKITPTHLAKEMLI